MTEKMRIREEEDAAITEISAWAKVSRPSFQDRQPYNRAICDRLAAAGIPPNGNLVYRIGQWGSVGAIGADVRGWMTEALAKVVPPGAIPGLPDAAQQVAHALLAELGRAVDAAVRLPLQVRIEEVEMAAAAARDERERERAQQQEQIQILETQKVDLQAQRDEARKDLAAQRADGQSQAGEAERAKRLFGEAAQRVRVLEAELAVATQQHAQELQLQRTGADLAVANTRHECDAQLRAAELQHGSALAALEREHAQALEQARIQYAAAIERERERVDGLQRSMHVMLDEVRGQAREARARIAQLERECEALRKRTKSARGSAANPRPSKTTSREE